MATLPATTVSEDEYLRTERDAVEKSEFYAGKIFAMSGGSSNHSLLAVSLTVLLYTQKQRRCYVHNSDMRLYIPASRVFTYPDCSVICGEPQFFGDRRDVLLNPVLLAEVLSPSSEHYDRGEKFEIYRNIPSLREYLLIHQDCRRVEHFSKQVDESWHLTDYVGNKSAVSLPSLGFHIALADLYAETTNCD